MQNISSLERTGNIRYIYFLVIGILVLFSFAVILKGEIGLLLSIFALMGLIITPFIYNKPNGFLFFLLFIYPFSGCLPLDNKFVITGGLYIISMPCIFWCLNKYYNKEMSVKWFHITAMLIYAGIVLLNFLRPGVDQLEAAKEFGRTFLGIFTILFMYNYFENSLEKLHKISRYISYTMNIIALIAIGQYFTGIGGLSIEGFYRIRGTFENFNEYGWVLTLFICFALYLFIITEDSKAKFYWGATVGLNIFTLLGTYSKTSILNAAVIFIIMSLFLPGKTRLQIFAGIAGICSMLGAYLVMSGKLAQLMLRFSDTHSLQWRYQMWNTLWRMIIHGNIWFGQGVNASRDFLEKVIPAGTSNAPHNVYLETFYNFGLAGLIPFILIFLFLLYKGQSIFFDKNLPNNQNRIIGVTLLIIIIITCIQNYVSNAFYDRSGNIIFWMITTLLICWYYHYKNPPATL